MSTDSLPSKARLRQIIRSRLGGLAAADRAELSRRGRELLVSHAAWQNAQRILFYCPLSDELDIWPAVELALAEGKSAWLPRFQADSGEYVACRVEDLARDLVTGKFGIREPAHFCARDPLNRLDLILVPGVAFDLHGCRLGRGKGFYDRLLASVCGLRCGVAFDEQIVPTILAEPHDAPVNCILTPTRWLEVSRGAALE